MYLKIHRTVMLVIKDDYSTDLRGLGSSFEYRTIHNNLKMFVLTSLLTIIVACFGKTYVPKEYKG